MGRLHLCCSEAGVFVVLRDGSMWWRRHEWLADRWQFVQPPPGATERRT